MAGPHGVGEGQGAAAAATGISRGAAGAQDQGRHAANGIDIHRAAEIDGDGDGVAAFVAAIGCAGADADDTRIGLLDVDRDDIGIGLLATGAGLPLVIGDDLQRSRAVVAGHRTEAQARQRIVDVGERAIEGHDSVDCPITGQERQARGAAQGDQPVDADERHAQAPTRDIHVRDGDRVAIAGAEDQRFVREHRLGTRHAVHRSVVHRADGQVEGGR